MLEIRKTDIYVQWLDNLRDIKARARVLARVERLASGNPGDVRPVGEGVSEMRIDYGPGYRVYYTMRGKTLIILLAGGDKPEEMAAYLEACFEEANGDAAFIAKALGDIARAKGMAQVARDAGLSRESLYKALSGERSPGFDTILKVMDALGLKLHAEASHG